MMLAMLPLAAANKYDNPDTLVVSRDGTDEFRTIGGLDSDASAKGKKMGTFRTYTLKVEGSYITLKDITIENNAAKLGQAVSLHIEGDHVLVQNCRLLGNQDTI